MKRFCKGMILFENYNSAKQKYGEILVRELTDKGFAAFERGHFIAEITLFCNFGATLYTSNYD